MNERQSDPASLDLSRDAMDALGAAVLERVNAHVASLGEQPITGDMDVDALCRELAEPPPEDGSSLDPLLDLLFDTCLPRTFNAPAPGYLAYVPGGGVYPSALADFISAATNRYTGVWNAAPALVQLEANVLDWFREWMQMPSTARGLLTAGGSMATFAAVVTAREKRLGTRLREGVLYTTSQAHHCVGKAARLAGILDDRVRAVPVDEEMRMRVDALDAMIADDRARGLEPFMVVSTAGTTNTGAVDPLDAIADLSARHGLWHHIDGAYGGFFHMCPELRPALSGLPRADSLVLDPHKGLFLPYGSGALLVRDGADLKSAHQVSAGYLPTMPDDFYNPCEYGPDLSRPNRGLRVWLPIKMFGAKRYRAALLEKHELAVQLAERIAALPHVRLLAPPTLSLFAFRVEPEGASAEQADAITSALMDRVTSYGRVMLSGTRLGPRYWGRACVLCFRTRQASIDACVEDCARAIDELTST